MSLAVSSAGAIVYWGDGASPEVFTAVAEVVTIGGPNPSAEEIDVTHLTSPGRYREFVQSFLDSGEIPLECNFLSSHIVPIIAEFEAGTIRNWRVYFPIDTPYNFTTEAYVSTYAVNAAVGEKISLSITLRLSGEPAWQTA